MYVTFIDYFLEREMPVMNDARKNYVGEFINNSFEHHLNSEFAYDLWGERPFDFEVIHVDSDLITIWLKQSGRDRMVETMDDLMTVLDARECVDWSKIPRDCGGTLTL